MRPQRYSLSATEILNKFTAACFRSRTGNASRAYDFDTSDSMSCSEPLFIFFVFSIARMFDTDDEIMYNGTTNVHWEVTEGVGAKDK